MSQKLIWEILRELGGIATTQQVRELAKKKYPELTLWEYAGNRLRKLQKNGYVSREYKNHIDTWTIIAEYKE